ncbi:MAG: carboxylating nicotinate-nucleotide diphosphorylase [Gemmataceae bacterium]
MTLNNAEIAAAKALIHLALVEDMGQRGDLTSSATIPENAVGQANVVARAAGVVAGLPLAALVFAAVDARLGFEPRTLDGAVVQPGDVLAMGAGPMRAILAAERTALNFLQHLSGVATLTRRYVDSAGGRAQIFDTRKTTPGWRLLEKYAVRCGGGHNHRLGLDNAILIKDNHVQALGGGVGGTRAAIAAARAHAPGLPIEVEVDSLEQFEAALAARPEIILLDNMNPDLLKQCVGRRDVVAKEVQLEASGGVNLETVVAIAATRVDRISVGALTHSAPALDIALDYTPATHVR